MRALSGILKGQSQKAEQEGFERFFKEIVLKIARQSQKAEQKGFARFFQETVLKKRLSSHPDQKLRNKHIS
jgi:hypothetical protein